jgi:annexin A7/11
MSNFEQEAIQLREAMKGGGTDEEVIIALTASKSNNDRQELRKAYKASFGRDLIEDLQDDIGGDFGKIVVAMYYSPIEYDALELYNAFKGMGSDEDAISEIIGSRSNYRLKEISGFYKIKYDEDLTERLKSETSGDYRSLLLSLMQCARDEESEVDDEKVQEDVNALFKAGEDKWGTDEETFNRIFALRSSYHLMRMNELYIEQKGTPLLEVVESEFGGDVKVLLKTVLHAHINPADYYAMRIYKACKGFGTDEKILIRSLVVMDEVFLEKMKVIYEVKYEMSLRDHIDSECSGDFKKMIMGLIDTCE